MRLLPNMTAMKPQQTLPSPADSTQLAKQTPPKTLANNGGVAFGNANNALSFGGGQKPSSMPQNSPSRNDNEMVQKMAQGIVQTLLGQISERLLAANEKQTPAENALKQPSSESSAPALPTAGGEKLEKKEAVQSNSVVNADGSIRATEKDIDGKPTEATGRPKGDTRSAEEIIDANPILKNLGDQKDINREGAYKQLGDWTEKNKDPQSRADAAYNAAKVLNWIDSSEGADGQDRSEVSGKGDLYGITKDGDARHGTPAGNWKDFTEKGYSALKDDHRLDKTKDTHVRADGTNKDNFQWFAGEVGKKLWFIPFVSNTLVGIGESKDGLGGAIKGGLSGYFGTIAAGLEGALDGLKKGKINPFQAILGAYTNQLANTDAAPDAVKKVADKI
ncbi:hypothetical protein [Pseudomonas sp. LRF_L74]|uniref:hypothetical protein n=1 Tax=Pseudomonas sp. LRF_L74 TaxID=3369422 RepID=UPI003F5FDFB2